MRRDEAMDLRNALLGRRGALTRVIKNMKARPEVDVTSLAAVANAVKAEVLAVMDEAVRNGWEPVTIHKSKSGSAYDDNAREWVTVHRTPCCDAEVAARHGFCPGCGRSIEWRE